MKGVCCLLWHALQQLDSVEVATQIAFARWDWLFRKQNTN
jgi:hypothetical protein